MNEPPIDHILGVLAITMSAASTPAPSAAWQPVPAAGADGLMPVARQPETGSCIVLPVDTAPCTSAGTQLARSGSKPNACSPDSLCLVRHEA